ncbi:16S rRNA (guanine(966)-N(2))-methyltransferase RsmD, partial [Streptococcus sobrinus]|uniref:16S rRNA (guanine(966)-N(2))-methyltransferase RsmD n=1 Tax=Streptococcus sobrinus TaxID=1310 RepID=UPI000373AE8F
SIYSMIGPFFAGGRVLDLYAGSGGLSIEAISRGMDQAVLVERDRRAQAVIEANIAMTKAQDQFRLIKRDAKQVLPTLTGQFDLVLLDPPYAKEEIVKTIGKLQEHDLLSPEVMIVCETDKSVDLPETLGDLRLWKQKVYGISKVTVYVK